MQAGSTFFHLPAKDKLSIISHALFKLCERFFDPDKDDQVWLPDYPTCFTYHISNAVITDDQLPLYKEDMTWKSDTLGSHLRNIAIERENFDTSNQVLLRLTHEDVNFVDAYVSVFCS
jgi:hypothetical protein